MVRIRPRVILWADGITMKQLLPQISMRTFRRRVASFDAIPQFAFLGVCSGFATGLVIVAFRQVIEFPLNLLLPEHSENFEALRWYAYFLLPMGGAILLAAGLSLIRQEYRQVGVTHVLQRLGRYQGHMPVGNLIAQFVAGTIALATGQSGGREGPAIHLGAAASSLMGQSFKLPNNSIRILVGCGAAAAISASFNTPIAGVIFSMEVILMEYTIAGFIPVILAAVVAALITRWVYGDATAFEVPSVAMASFSDLPFLLVEGFLLGCIAAAFVRMIQMIHQVAPVSLGLRMLVAGFCTGAIALAVPQVLGIGYDTVNAALLGDLGLVVLMAACVFKLLTSATTIAMGMPVGLIGPALFIGATGGGLMAVLASYFTDDLSSPAFYVMLGMGAMMGAVLQAPLAALMAVMEMTHNPNIILPAMLVIIVANITAGELFKMKSVFHLQMEMLGLEFRQNPLSMALSRASVASIMTRSFERVPRLVHTELANQLDHEKPHWLLVETPDGLKEILRTEDFLSYYSEHRDQTEIDLAEIPATRRDVTSILLQATLSEALQTLNHSGVQALYVNRISAPLLDSPVGIVTREDIESYYLE